ncbi:MAG: hypothetical protein KBT15_06040 [Bacteroidales bacterium]|nr:hypothetical protein [Candidatus Minthousia equi]
MKRMMFGALMALMMLALPASVKAEDYKTACGMIVDLPEGVNVMTDNQQVAIMSTEDYKFTITVMPLPEEATDEEIEQGIAQIAQSANIDTESVESTKQETEEFEMGVITGEIENGGLVIAVCAHKATGRRFLVSGVTTDENAELLGEVIGKLRLEE